ncbi:uncharacterized protein PFLUO_LOCUS3540 [Penicillium psychrofluorescens]|uniref:uncharacterized protein n=1 Tax=Penicillium psychrofluorescens TaxID=3158075 RepID=UPI003CCD4E0C
MFPTNSTAAVTSLPGQSTTALTAGPIQRSVSVFAHTSHAQHPVFVVSAFGTIVASVNRSVSRAPGQFDQLPQTEPQKILKDIVIPRLTNSQALFYFGVLATKAHLNPQFTFKYGLQGAHRVGVLLTLYGHTIAIGPRYATARGAKAAACRQALAELREYNPQWPLPAEPTEGPTDVTWNWTQLLEEHCAQNGLPSPKYTPRHEFCCNVLVNGEKLSTWRQCSSLHEAQQTVAHVAFHQLMV